VPGAGRLNSVGEYESMLTHSKLASQSPTVQVIRSLSAAAPTVPIGANGVPKFAAASPHRARYSTGYGRPLDICRSRETRPRRNRCRSVPDWCEASHLTV